MHTIVVSVNHRTAPVEIREKLAFVETEVCAAMQTLQEQKSILENIILSTCNRTEIYAVVDQLHTGRYYVKLFLSEWFNIPIKSFEQYLTIYENDQAIEHLMQVSVGMDSMVLGETQILGQVRDRFLEAQSIGTTGTIFNELFKQAVTFAKKAHSTTEIGANAVSISYAAVELGKQIFGTLNHKHIAILGAGEMGELALQNLRGSGASELTVINRTLETAEAMAQQYGGKAQSMDEVQSALIDADVLISSTAATEYVLTYEVMKEVEQLRKGDPIFLIDIAVPRDLDPKIAEIPNVFLYDIDDLQGIVDANLAERERAADKISGFIDEEIIAFNEWLTTLGVVPVINALREKALGIQSTTMESILNKIPDLDERERKVLSKHTKSIINQLLKEPILQAKEIAMESNSSEKLQFFQQIFGIDEEIVKEKEMLAQAAQKRLKERAKKAASTQPGLKFQ